MVESYVKASGVCGNCGGNLITADNNPTDESVVTCEKCGAVVCTHGEMNAELGKAARAKAEEIAANAIAKFRGSLRGNKNITFKIR